MCGQDCNLTSATDLGLRQGKRIPVQVLVRTKRLLINGHNWLALFNCGQVSNVDLVAKELKRDLGLTGNRSSASARVVVANGQIELATLIWEALRSLGIKARVTFVGVSETDPMLQSPSLKNLARYLPPPAETRRDADSYTVSVEDCLSGWLALNRILRLRADFDTVGASIADAAAFVASKRMDTISETYAILALSGECMGGGVLDGLMWAYWERYDK